jgi:hypothetical protein
VCCCVGVVAVVVVVVVVVVSYSPRDKADHQGNPIKVVNPMLYTIPKSSPFSFMAGI